MMRRKNFTRGLITGAMLGATVSMMINPGEGHHRRMAKRKAGRFARAVGDIIGDIVDMRR